MRNINTVLSRFILILISLTIIPTISFAQWIQTNGPGGGNVSAVASNETYLFASAGATLGYGSGVYRSSDDGVTWDLLETPLPTNNRSFKNISSIVVSGNNVAASAPGGGVVFVSTNNGDSWETTVRNKVVMLTTDGTRFIAGTDGDGIYFLEFGTTIWLPLKAGLSAEKITSILIDGATMYATAWYAPLSVSTNSGLSWTSVPLPSSSFNAFSVALINNKLYVGAQNGVIVSSDNGATWTGPIPGISGSVTAFIQVGSKIFTGGGGGLYSAPASGGDWVLFSNKYSVSSFQKTGSGLFMSAFNSYFSGGGGVFFSADDGTTWEARTAGLSATTVQGLAMNGSTLLAITSGHGLFSSTDKGETWELLTKDAKSYDGTLQTILVTDGKIFARSENGYVSSTDNGDTWTATNPGFIPQGFFAYDSKIFAGESNGIRISTDGGSSWTQSNTGLTGYLSTNCFGAKGNKIFAGLYSEGVFISTNGGDSWTASNSGLTNLRVRSFAFLGDNVFAATDDGGVFISTNDGSSWAESNSGLSSKNIWSLEVSGSRIFAGCNDGVFVSNDSGKTWESTSPWPIISNTVLVTETDIFAGTLAGGVWTRPLSNITAVEQNSQIVPEEFSLNQNYPNPFNPSTVISYNLPLRNNVSLKVYDVLGNEIAELINEEQEAGVHSVNFNAMKLSSGIYFYRVNAGKISETKSMLLIK